MQNNSGQTFMEVSQTQNLTDLPKQPRESSFVSLSKEKFQFKRQYAVEKRMQWSEEAREKYATKLPVVIEKDIRCTTLDDLQNPKYVYFNSHQLQFQIFDAPKLFNQ